MDIKQVPELLRTAREQEMLSQAELADRIGVSKRSIQKWEGGKVAPKYAQRRILAAFFRECGLS